MLTASTCQSSSSPVSSGNAPFFFFFQAEDGIRDLIVTGVQTCALPISGTVLNAEAARRCLDAGAHFLVSPGLNLQTVELAVREGKLIMAGALTPTEVITEIGRASCRERV